jgi:hypothetical protein
MAETGMQVDGGRQIKRASITPDRLTNGQPVGEDLFAEVGDLAVGSGVGTAGRLDAPTGHNGWVLKRDDTQPLGVLWAPVGLGFGHDIQDEGSVLPTRAGLNFVGTAVAVTDDAPNNATVVTITATGGGGGGGSGHVIQDEGTALPTEAALNFTGPGVLVSDDPVNGRTVVSIAAAGAGYTRLTTTKSSGGLGVGASLQSTVAMAAAARIYRVATDKPCRVRMYTTAAKQAADLARAIGTDPAGDHGCALDLVFTSSLMSLDLAPVVDVVDLKSTPDGLLPITITNTDTSSGAATVTFTYVRIE